MRSVSFFALFLGLLFIRPATVWAIDPAELDQIERLLVGYAAIDTAEFRAEIRRVYSGKTQKNTTLRDVAAVLAFIDKRGCSDGFTGERGKLQTALVPFSVLRYPTVAARIALLDYLFGVEDANENLRRNSEALRLTHRIMNHTKRLSDGAPPWSSGVVKTLAKQIGSSTDIDLKVVGEVLTEERLVPIDKVQPPKKAKITIVSKEEIDALIEKYMGQRAETLSVREPPLAGASEPELLAMLSFSEPMELLAANELNRRTKLTGDTLFGILRHLQERATKSKDSEEVLRRALAWNSGNLLQALIQDPEHYPSAFECIQEILELSQ